MKKKVEIHKFDPVIYPMKLWVSFGDEDQLETVFSLPPKGEVSTPDYGFGFTALTFEHSTSLQGVIVHFNSRKECSIKDIAHEASHAVDKMWHRLGEEAPGSEANAYLMGWIAHCIKEARDNGRNKS